MFPDYGLMILRSGLGQVTQYLYDVPLTHLSVSAPGLLTSIVNKVHAGVEYAVSFDLSPPFAEAVLAKLEPNERRAAIAALARARPGQTVEFSYPVVVHLQARLGTPQRVTAEEFIPLVVEHVG